VKRTGYADDGRPRGYLVVDCPARHRCALPDRGRVGTAWRCGCGRLWIVWDPPMPTRGQVRADPSVWIRAGWLTRWRYRNARTATPSEVGARSSRPPTGPSGLSR